MVTVYVHICVETTFFLCFKSKTVNLKKNSHHNSIKCLDLPWKTETTVYTESVVKTCLPFSSAVCKLIKTTYQLWKINIWFWNVFPRCIIISAIHRVKTKKKKIHLYPWHEDKCNYECLDKFCTTGQVINCVEFSSSCLRSISVDSEPRNTHLSKIFNLSLLNKSLAEKFACTSKKFILEPIPKSCKKCLNNYNKIEWVEKTVKKLQSAFSLKA